jgi:hypothetical protein
MDGVCMQLSIPGCCSSDAQCDDGNPCTTSYCDGGVCDNAPTSGEACDDGNECTYNDTCVDGQCAVVNVYTEVEGCCQGQNDCADDGDACTDNVCVNYWCEQQPVADCCEDPDDCGPGETCVDGVCAPDD